MGRHRRRFTQFRAGFLGLLGAASVAYGGAIILAVARTRAPWLPQNGPIGYLPPGVWGWAWAGSGVLELGLCWLPATRRWLFGLAAAVAGAWAAAYTAHWIRHGQPGGWGPAVTSALLALLILLTSAWPDPP